MASTDKPDPEYYSKETAYSAPPPPSSKGFSMDVILRFLVFAASVTSVVVMVTSKQTKASGVRNVPALVAKFNHSPAFIYFVAALSVAALYSLITTIASLFAIFKRHVSPKCLLHFAFFDVLILGLVASATGTAGGVAYIGLKGNEHVRWNEVCNVFDKFCRHVGSAIAVSLFASVVLVILIWFSLFSIRSRLSK